MSKKQPTRQPHGRQPFGHLGWSSKVVFLTLPVIGKSPGYGVLGLRLKIDSSFSAGSCFSIPGTGIVSNVGSIAGVVGGLRCGKGANCGDSCFSESSVVRLMVVSERGELGGQGGDERRDQVEVGTCLPKWDVSDRFFSSTSKSEKQLTALEAISRTILELRKHFHI